MRRLILPLIIVGTLFWSSANAQENVGIITINMEDMVPIITFGDLVIEFAEHIGMAALKQVVEENGYGSIELNEYPAANIFRDLLNKQLKNNNYKVTLNISGDKEELEIYAREYGLDKIIVVVNPVVGIATFQSDEKYDKDGWAGYWNVSVAAASAIIFEIGAAEKTLLVNPKVVRGFDLCTWVTITDRPKVTSSGGDFWERLASSLVEKTIDAGIKEMTKPYKTPKVLKYNAIHNAIQEACDFIR